MRTGGGFRSPSQSTILRAGLGLVAVAFLSLAVSACGSSTAQPATSVAPNNVISRAEADKPPAGSVEHTFLEYWSDLQFSSWADVAAYYDPSFRASIGTASIIGGKKVNGSNYPQLKPSIVRVTDAPGLTTIKYTLEFIDGSEELASISWRKVGGNWQIIYDSRLDAELSQYAENRSEIAQNGTLPVEGETTSPDAARAGAIAAQAQARFLQQDLDLKSP